MTPGRGRGTASAHQSAMHGALKLRRLHGIFEDYAKNWSLEFTAREAWPGLALVNSSVFLSRCLELRLQSYFLLDNREFYEFVFSERWRPALGGRKRQGFCCGRLYADEVLSERRIRRELAHRARLLGLVRPGAV